jgi:hypothetical protein
MEYQNFGSQNQELAYDLRQIYARLVGEHMLDISEARKQNNLYLWYKALEDLHTIIKHKFKDKKKDEEAYVKQIEDITDLANKYTNSWCGVNKNAKEVAEIESALRKIEEFLYLKMNEAKMFGEAGRIAGL